MPKAPRTPFADGDSEGSAQLFGRSPSDVLPAPDLGNSFQNGSPLIRHVRYAILQPPKSHLTRSLSGQILGRIERIVALDHERRESARWP